MKQRKRILVVDDDKDILKSFKAILQEEGYDVDTAETSREAIEKTERQAYDLALLDIKLPDVDGTELLELLSERFPKMVKIMITGYPSLQNAAESLKHGAAAYVMKPVQPESLLKVVEEKLREKEEDGGGNK